MFYVVFTCNLSFVGKIQETSTSTINIITMFFFSCTWGGWIILSLWMCVYVIMPFHSPVCPESSFFQTSFLSSVTILLATRAVFSFHLIGSSVLLSSSRCLLPPLFPVLCFHVVSTEAACLFSTLRLGMVLHNRPNLINHLHHAVWCGLICGDSNQSRMTC